MKKAKRFLALTALAACGLTSLVGCNSNKFSNIKLGLILLHPHDTSTYDKNFYEAVDAASKELGFSYVWRENIPEGAECTTVADELADEGCNIIFADSFGHEAHLMASAKKHPDITYMHATGNQAAANSDTVKNFYDAFASIYQGRYLAGIAAGMKLKSMIEANPDTPHNVGYVGAYTYSEVTSGLSSWYLGVKSIVSDVTMDVLYTGSWFDINEEKNCALQLINTYKCAVISQHADSYGAPQACEDSHVPNVSYNYSTENVGPTTYLVASKIDWSVWVKNVVTCVAENKPIKQDFVGSLSDGAVKVMECSANCAPGTQAAVDEAAAKLKAGTLKVFDTNNFTVNGEKLTSHKIEINGVQQETIIDGEYKESYYISAPYQDFTIDGITYRNTKF